MDLWIRSQDKESLTKVSNISLKEIRKPFTNELDCYGIGTYYDNLQVLGKYTTKKRALEVLDDIQSILTIKLTYKPVVQEEYNMLYPYKHFEKVDDNMEIKELSTFIYQMPKE